MLAYLVIREGSKWTDVFRLVPGRTATIGRAATNSIVIKDERCSRYHAEIFMTQGAWTLRDLESRNGTVIGDESIQGDYMLSPGEIVRIAHCQLAFVHDLSKAFPDSNTGDSGMGIFKSPPDGDETVSARAAMLADSGDSHVLNSFEPATITHRRNQTKYLKAEEADDNAIPKVGRAATKLCALAFELANSTKAAEVANLALNGLFESTNVDAGAVLLAPRELDTAPEGNELEILATRHDTDPRYHRVSSFLANTVLREGEAVLARNVEDDSTLGSRDSKGDILSTSVICAPIRRDKKAIGLIHLYSTNDQYTLDPDDLEFTLAVADNVALALRNINKQEELAENLTQTKSEVVQLRRQLGAESEIVGSSGPIDRLKQEIERAAPTRATVLIRGESGVGKELVARAVHYSSPRRKGPFVCLNCAALSETLLESELFGHERGAFTGATERKVGKFEAAHRGTLMLDEIGEMSPAIQAKFLRALEGHPFERVGGSQPIKVEVRVIAATNRNLENAVADGTFRRDLYFRLNVVEIRVMPLRKRMEDVPELSSFFLEKFNEETGRRILGFSDGAMNMLRGYHWPGNIRELKNVVERAVVLAQGNYVEVEDLALSNLASPSESGVMDFGPQSYEPKSLSDMEREHIRATLDETGWNKSKAAGILGIERSTLDRKIRRYELTPD